MILKSWRNLLLFLDLWLVGVIIGSWDLILLHRRYLLLLLLLWRTLVIFTIVKILKHLFKLCRRDGIRIPCWLHSSGLFCEWFSTFDWRVLHARKKSLVMRKRCSCCLCIFDKQRRLWNLLNLTTSEKFFMHAFWGQFKICSLVVTEILMRHKLVTFSPHVIWKSTVLARSWSKRWELLMRRHEPEHLLHGLLLRIQAWNQMFDMHCNCSNMCVAVNHGFHYCTVLSLDEHAVVTYSSTARWCPRWPSKWRLSRQTVEERRGLLKITPLVNVTLLGEHRCAHFYLPINCCPLIRSVLLSKLIIRWNASWTWVFGASASSSAVSFEHGALTASSDSSSSDCLATLRSVSGAKCVWEIVLVYIISGRYSMSDQVIYICKSKPIAFNQLHLGTRPCVRVTTRTLHLWHHFLYTLEDYNF